MAKLNRIVRVRLTSLTRTIRKNDFNRLLIVGEHDLKQGRVFAVTSADELLDLGMKADHDLYKAVNVAFAQKPATDVVYIGNRKMSGSGGKAEDWPTTLQAIRKENDLWYGIAITSRQPEDILAVADWAESAEKLFGTVAAQEAFDGSNTQDIASQLKAKNLTHTFVLASTHPELFYEVALMSRCFTIYPGGETWANKSLTVVTGDELLESQYHAARKKNASTYEVFNGDFPLTQTGKVASGEWIDVVRFGDWLKAEMQADVVAALTNANKLPYTDEGIGIIKNAMLSSLALGRARGGIAPDSLDESGDVLPSWVITAPLARDISANNKGLRVLKDVGCKVRLAGAIHNVDIAIQFVY
ncbi:MAG: DUF3383 family protein [Candidatus Symbiopectobacterium sp. Dall1.0]|nr:DUF3383 family protein [Candidatus Symbiopectobacterium sp. Dall1.0]